MIAAALVRFSEMIGAAFWCALISAALYAFA
jgi:hypothetical protein